MPEKCRLSVCGFDPMLVKGYVKTGYRALWFYLPDELWADYPVKINDKIQGKLLAVYNPKEEKTHEPNESFNGSPAKRPATPFSSRPTSIVKYKLTEFHFVEMSLDFWVSATK